MPRLTQRSLLLLAGWLFAAPAVAGIYTWTDGHGVRHYSDTRAAPSAEIANLSNIPGLAAGGSKPAGSRLQGPTVASDARALALIQPHNDVVFHERGEVPVVLKVHGLADDALKDGETLVYYLDGKTLPQSPTTATRLILTHVALGQHQLSVALLYRGHEVQHSTPVSFAVSSAPAPVAQSAPGSEGDRPPS